MLFIVDLIRYIGILIINGVLFHSIHNCKDIKGAIFIACLLIVLNIWSAAFTIRDVIERKS